MDLLVSRELPHTSEPAFHVDVLDLYQARQRVAFVKQAANELGTKEDTIKRDLGRLLLQLEGLQEQQLRKATEPKVPLVKLTEAQQTVALDLLQDPKLLDRVLADFDRCGGGRADEQARRLPGGDQPEATGPPLALISSPRPPPGKTSLMEAILSFVPEEERMSFSAMTGQSLFYMGRGTRHKVLAIAEEEGAERASYALKLLSFGGPASIASTGKDASGRMVARSTGSKGPHALPDHHGRGDRRRAAQPLHRPHGERDAGADAAIHRLQREAQTLAGIAKRQEREAIRKSTERAAAAPAAPGVNPFAPS